MAGNIVWKSDQLFVTVCCVSSTQVTHILLATTWWKWLLGCSGQTPAWRGRRSLWSQAHGYAFLKSMQRTSHSHKYIHPHPHPPPPYSQNMKQVITGQMQCNWTLNFNTHTHKCVVENKQGMSISSLRSKVLKTTTNKSWETVTLFYTVIQAKKKPI